MMIWWYTLPCNVSDYEFAFEYIRKDYDMDILKKILMNRLLRKLIDNDGDRRLVKILKYCFIYSDNGSKDEFTYICLNMYELFMKNMLSKRVAENNEFYHCVNRVIRNLRDSGLVEIESDDGSGKYLVQRLYENLGYAKNGRKVTE